MARADGYRVVDRGECRGGSGPGPIGPGPGRPEFCTREYAPVCATRGRRTETFPNACEARREGFRVIDRGECRMSRPGRPRG